MGEGAHMLGVLGSEFNLWQLRSERAERDRDLSCAMPLRTRPYRRSSGAGACIFWIIDGAELVLAGIARGLDRMPRIAWRARRNDGIHRNSRRCAVQRGGMLRRRLAPVATRTPVSGGSAPSIGGIRADAPCGRARTP